MYGFVGCREINAKRLSVNGCTGEFIVQVPVLVVESPRTMTIDCRASIWWLWRSCSSASAREWWLRGSYWGSLLLLPSPMPWDRWAASLSPFPCSNRTLKHKTNVNNVSSVHSGVHNQTTAIKNESNINPQHNNIQNIIQDRSGVWGRWAPTAPGPWRQNSTIFATSTTVDSTVLALTAVTMVLLFESILMASDGVDGSGLGVCYNCE